MIFLLFSIFQCNVYATVQTDVDILTSKGVSARNHDPESTSIAGNTVAFVHEGFKPNHVRGARLFDDFTVELDLVPTVANDLLLLATPTDPAMLPPSIADSWRCSHCHGFDYKGGIYTFANGVTPNLVASREIRKITEDDVFNILMNGINVFDGTTHINTHNYSLLLGLPNVQPIVDIADFIVNEIFDPSQFVRSSTNESVLNHMSSLYIYKGAADPILEPNPLAVRVNGLNFTCTECHGLTGRQVPGVDLYVLAWTEPYKWMHRTNFGTPRSQALVPGIIAEDPTIHPGVYEVMLIKGLHFGGSRNTAQLLEYVQTHFQP